MLFAVSPSHCIDQGVIFATQNQTKQQMTENKTVKYHIPQQGIYMYARMRDGETGMIVLNSTDHEQILSAEYYKPLTKDSKMGKELSTGKVIDFSQNLTLSPRKSLIIEF